MFEQTITYDKTSAIWTSPKSVSLFNKSVSIGHVALTLMRTQPSDRICQISVTENTKLTYGEACQRAVQLAQYLKNQGLTEEDVIGIVTTNTTYLMPVMLGCWLNCTPFHMVSTTFDEATLKNLFFITKPRIIFCDGTYYENLRAALKDLQIEYYTICNHLECVPKLEVLFEKNNASPLYKPVPLKHGSNQPMAIYCTSGTTGQPKCVPYPNSRCLIDIGYVDSSMIIYSTSVPSWGTALLATTYTMLYGCQRIITNQAPTTENLIDLLKKYNITYLTVTPMQMVQLLHQSNFTMSNLPKLKLVFITGSACTTATLQHFKKCFPTSYLIQSYGSTESGGIALNLTQYEMGVLGKLAQNLQLKIVDPTTKKALGYNENGEICVKPQLEKWIGYIGNKEASLEIIDNEGWLHTGDLGYMDDENTLHFVDRCKDILKYKGYQYSPNEIESVINELKEVKDVCVFGVFNEEFGDLAAAAIVKVEGSNLTEAEVISYVAKHLILEQKCLNYGVFFVKEIFRNPNGKLLRKEMRDFCLRTLELKD